MALANKITECIVIDELQSPISSPGKCNRMQRKNELRASDTATQLIKVKDTS